MRKRNMNDIFSTPRTSTPQESIKEDSQVSINPGKKIKRSYDLAPETLDSLDEMVKLRRRQGQKATRQSLIDEAVQLLAENTLDKPSSV